MQSSHFGPIWETFFLTAMGYHLNPEKCKIKDPEYIKFFELVGSTIPCKHCRISYKGFFKELSIEKYMKKKDFGLVEWVYLLKEKVNDKLKKQEEEALEKGFHETLKSYKTTDPKFWKAFREKAQKIIYTKSSPEYVDVLEKYKNLRADCSGPAKHCRTPLNDTKKKSLKKKSRKNK